MPYLGNAETENLKVRNNEITFLMVGNKEMKLLRILNDIIILLKIKLIEIAVVDLPNFKHSIAF